MEDLENNDEVGSILKPKEGAKPPSQPQTTKGRVVGEPGFPTKVKRTLTDEQREAQRERMKKVNADRIEKARLANEAISKAKQEELEKLSHAESTKPITGKNTKKDLAKLEKAISTVRSVKGLENTAVAKPKLKPKSKPIIIVQEDSSSDESESEEGAQPPSQPHNRRVRKGTLVPCYESDDEPPIVVMKKPKPKTKTSEKPKPQANQQSTQPPPPKTVCRFI